jgi:methionyl aminopeptidase
VKKFRGVYLKNEQEIAIMREANRIVSRILDALGREVRPGVQTMFFEELAQKLCAEYKVTPAFQGYQGYPFALCCSVNEEIVHGFPSKRILKEGDIVSFDMGVIHDGFFGDSARTYTVGEISVKAMDLLEVTRNSLLKGIAQAREGNSVQDISRAIQGYVEAKGYNVVKRFVGHGIGRRLHEKPEVPNFVPPGTQEMPLKAGMVLAIEPMVTMGQADVDILADNWTAVTKDRQLSAHFEHTVAVTKNGPEILSVSD